MIRAAAWFCGEHCGVYSAAGASWEQPSPAFSAIEIPALIGRPVKYYPRMTAETRCCLCAASIAMKFAGWDSNACEIGLISAGSDGCLRANEEYFRDYVVNGRTLGRGNLFIYTLTTSALGEAGIALNLTGPCMFIQDGEEPVAALGRMGGRMISDGEAHGMLGLWSDSEAAVCLVIEDGVGKKKEESSPNPAETIGGQGKGEKGETDPLQLCRKLRALVRRT